MGYHYIPDRMLYFKEYKELGAKLFGPDTKQWRFYCLHCRKDHTRAEAMVKWPEPTSIMVGQVCVHCEKRAEAPTVYGIPKSIRILAMPEDIPERDDIPPQGRMIYGLYFWADGETVPPTPAAQVVGEIIEIVGEPKPPPAPAPKPAAPKKAGPSGYGFRF